MPVRDRISDPVVPGPVACESCDLGEICLILDSERNCLPQGKLRAVSAGEVLHRTGMPAEHIYATRKGVLKAVRTAPGSQSRLLALHLPGEAFGMEAFTTGVYQNDVVALTSSVCCELPLSAFDPQNLGRVPDLALTLIQLRNRLHASHVAHSARALLPRVRAFFLALALRLGRCGFKPDRLLLEITREEIGSLFGRRIGSTRRVLKLLAQEGVIALERNGLRLGFKTQQDVARSRQRHQ